MPSPGRTSPCYIAEPPDALEADSLVLGLEAPGARQGRMVGAKAQRLAEMLQLGLPVPAGFCVTVAAYERFVDAAGLRPALDRALAQASDDPRGAAALAQAALRRSAFPPELAAAIAGSFRALAGGRAPAGVAVRSSALDEDGGAESFAGVHSSFLDLRGEDAVLDAVRRCWASFWSEAALAYRTARAALRPIRGAVIVQRMIHADAAGVLFTADPLDGACGRLIVEAVAGVGERLVSGEATPARYALDRTGRVMESAHSQDCGPLGAGFLKDLAAIALRIESAYRLPQDIEWAKHGSALYVLQTRPITVRPPSPGGAPDPAVWTRKSIGERFPDPLMPLEATFVAEWVFAPGFRRLFQSMGAPRELGQQVFRTFGGLAHLNRVLLADLLRGVPRELALSVAEGAADLAGAPIRPSLPIACTAFRLLRIIARRHREFARQAPGFELRCREIRRRRFERRAAGELRKDLEDFRSLISEMSHGHLESIAAAEILMSVAVKLATEWAPGVEPHQVHLLTTGRLENQTYAMSLHFAALVDAAGAHPEIAGAFVGREPAAVLPRLGELASISVQAAAFLQSFNSFLDRFGHRTAKYNLSHPRWRENPNELVQLIQSHLESPPAPPAGAGDERDRLLASLLARAPWWKRPLLRAVLRRARIYCGALRENENHYITMPFPDLKRLLNVLAANLQAEGALRDAGDLYFLTMRELEAAAEGRGAPSPEVLARRRREYEAARAALLREGPAPFGGQPPGAALRGTPASPGEVSGAARVLLEPAGRIERGEILVTRFLNASWTPVLRLAGGVVTDIGGMLSHGAVIARELGVPAVVGVEGATSVIRDGQLLTVCGTRGAVLIESGDVNHNA